MTLTHDGPPTPVETWCSPRGRLAIEKPVPGVIRFTYDGYMTADVVPFLASSVKKVLDAGLCPDLFIDLTQMKSYDSDYRKAISKWGSENYRRFGEVRVLVRSKLIAMGIAVSNLTAEGKLKPTTQRSEFESALSLAVARHSSQQVGPPGSVRAHDVPAGPSDGDKRSKRSP